MATVNVIPEAKQSPSAMRGLINYCLRKEKTFDVNSGRKLITGINCIGENAYIQGKHTETVKDVENALKQDGKMRENFISEFSSEMRTNLEALEEATDMLKKHLLKLLAITIGAATLFSTLVSGLLQLWLR